MLLDIKNKIDFALRNFFKFSRKGFFVPSESKNGLFKGDTLKKERIFYTKYDLKYIEATATKRNYKENLYTIDLLETYLKPEKKENLKVIDIGSKNWFYATGEYHFFRKYSKKLKLDGIEIDAYRVYSNLYSRYDAAMYYSKHLENTNYIADDFLNHKGKYDYIVWILPFITKTPLEAWGLPNEYFKPEKLLQKAYNDLEENGSMIIVNQGEKEYGVQKELLEKLQIPYEDCGEFKSDFLKYKHKRFVFVIKKPA